MLNLTDLKPGVDFELEKQPYIVVSREHTKLGRGGAILRTRIRNLLTGSIIDRTFKGSENFPELDLEKKKSQYLYRDNDEFYFMNNEDFSQFSLKEKDLGDTHNFLKDGENVEILYYNQKPINVQLPIKLDFEVTYTEPGFKGNTASATTKSATLETGAQIQVPLFIKIGDKIRVNTETGEYVERIM